MSVADNLKRIHQTIAETAAAYNRDPGSVHVVAVSKQQPQERVLEALAAGQRLFGENRVQEARGRWSALKPEYPDLKLHLVGPLQTNKVREALQLFDVIETLDRENLARELAQEMAKQNKRIPCFIQVNTGAEPQKSGIAPEALPEFLKLCRDGCGLDVRGLMCLPPAEDPPALHFALLAKLAKENSLSDLSMGMSGDFEKAIPLGATSIRLGTAVFGARNDDQ